MKTDQLDYELPSELIAQEPAVVRSGSRLLVLARSTGTLVDSRFSRLADFLRPGDCLVLNDTKVLPARFFARRTTGGKLEGLFLREAPHIIARSAATKQSAAIGPERAKCGTRVWEVMLKGARKVRLGESICVEDREQRVFCTAKVLEKRQEGVCLLEVQTPVGAEAILNEIGFPPLPPYIRRDHDPARAQSDRERYQTVYARHPGAVAAPTAGLHFTDELIGQLKAAGVGFAHVTLHVGAGTFKPIATEQVEQHEIHSEWYRLDAKNADLLNATRRNGGRVVAVGTTATRVLETVANVGWVLNPRVAPIDAHETRGLRTHPTSAEAQGQLPACEGTTSLFITPGYEFKIADAMITNFHLPRSTLLALVSAFAGLENTLAAYRHAIEQRYRFYSYGDAMLIA